MPTTGCTPTLAPPCGFPMRRREGHYPIYQLLSDGRWVSSINIIHTFWAIYFQDLDPVTRKPWSDFYWRRCKCSFDAEDRLHNDTGPAAWIPEKVASQG